NLWQSQSRDSVAPAAATATAPVTEATEPQQTAEPSQVDASLQAAAPLESAAETSAAVEPKPEPQPAQIAVSADLQSAAAPAPAEAEAAAQPQTQVTSDDILERRLALTRQWLSQQPATTVSIQLMGSANDDQLRRQLEALAREMELDNLYVYRTQVNNAPFLTVLYGSYDSRQAAQEAMRQLPAGLRAYRPHLRTVGGILQETMKFQ